MIAQWIIGNWKMYGTYDQGLEWGRVLAEKRKERSIESRMIVCPSAAMIGALSSVLRQTPIEIGAQDCHSELSGPFTGDISASMLFDIGCRYVLLGHSERRHNHNESNALIQQKIHAALQANLTVILCIGETAAEYDARQTRQTLLQQLDNALSDRMMIAYEPVWAIGSGTPASLETIKDVHAMIYTFLQDRALQTIPLLYGGSVTETNAAQILSLPHVNGVLVGKTSLDPEKFWRIAANA